MLLWDSHVVPRVLCVKQLQSIYDFGTVHVIRREQQDIKSKIYHYYYYYLDY